MCGRMVRKDTGEEVVSFFEINDLRIPWQPSYNVAPTLGIPVVRRQANGNRELCEMRWGLIPFWAKPDVKLPLMINARADSITDKPSYREAFKKRRCIVPASGYFEWKKRPDGLKQPYYFQRVDGQPLAFAAIWDGETVATITTEPNPEARAVHDRMPVILQKDQFTRFLDPEPLEEAERKTFLAPLPAGTLETWPVNRAVGNVRNNNVHLTEPLE